MNVSNKKYIKDINKISFCRDLVSSGARFQINHNIDDDFSELIDGVSDDDECDEFIQTPWTKSFAELKQQMEQVPNDEEDGAEDDPSFKIYKRVIKEGEGPKLGDMKARVECHYDSFLEKQERAFDSTNLRKSCLSFVTKKGSLIYGLEKAIRTMRKKEEAQFIIGYELLYGKMGCPPRIPPKTNCLYVVQLINFTETGDDNACEQIEEADKRKFQVVKKKAEEARKRGVECFELVQYDKACRSFHSAISALEFCELENEEEQNEQCNLLIKLYTNLAVCYNKREMWNKTCTMCNDLSRITQIKGDLKILFNYATALLQLGDYEQARKHARYAYVLDKENVKTNRLLAEIDKQQQAFKNNEVKFYQKMFAVADKAEKNSK